MTLCQFGRDQRVVYEDIDSEDLPTRIKDFQCSIESVTNRGYCKFHDYNYATNNPDDVINSFYTLLDKSETKNQPLLFIGFVLPQPLRFPSDKKFFEKTIYFDKCKLFDIDFTSIKFDKLSFREAELKKISFEKCSIEKASFKDSSLYTVSFDRATLNKTDFAGATLKRVCFSRSKLNISFGENYLESCSFHGAEMNRVSFSHLVFTGARFNTAKFVDVDFANVEFRQNVSFFVSEFTKATFHKVDFKDEVEFEFTYFPPEPSNLDSKNIDIPIQFDYSTFRSRCRFIGRPERHLELGAVSFKGVDLSNVEFHNVDWLKGRIKQSVRKGFVSRNMIIDELFLDKKKNFEEVSKIYNELRKNYEIRLLFNEASNFFVGEMEAIRKSH
jgi:uncharacterized protein YjbI with pentapeptide repeats